MNQKFGFLFAALVATGFISIATMANAHDDPASGHFICDDTSQNSSCGFNITTGWNVVDVSGAGGNKASVSTLTSSTLSNYRTANWYIQTNDRVGTGNYYGWDVYVPRYGGVLHDAARYFKDGSLYTKINQEAYKGSWVTLGSPYMSDNTQYRYTVDNYRDAFDYKSVIADAIHFYD